MTAPTGERMHDPAYISLTITEWEAVRAELDRLRTEIMALKKAGWDLAYCAEKFSLGLSPAIGAIAEEALGRWREVAGEKEKT